MNDTATTEIYTLSLHDALPISIERIVPVRADAHARFDALSRRYQYIVSEKKDPFDYETVCRMSLRGMDFEAMNEAAEDRKSTRLTSSHANISYAVCCVNKKTPP